MQTVKIVCAIAVVAGFVALTAPQAEARPGYLMAFAGKYENLKAAAEEKKCGVCHGKGGADKKAVSAYGKAVAEALGAKNVKEADKIAKALTDVEGKKCGDGDKTWGDVLKAGLPPAAE